ncbi:MAG: DUF6295 family protein [Chloroflexi bacterium]|nr:DUF6295 family protein [Chloroflexota bacterium]
MCTYIVEKAKISGSGKGANGWFSVTQANVCYDHPHHAPYEHTLNIDFVNEAEGIGARVAVELTAESARALVEKILAALETGDAQHAR